MKAWDVVTTPGVWVCMCVCFFLVCVCVVVVVVVVVGWGGCRGRFVEDLTLHAWGVGEAKIKVNGGRVSACCWSSRRLARSGTSSRRLPTFN